MNNKKKLLSTLILSALTATGCTAASKPELTREPADKPNVIIMFLDDAAYADLSSFGGKYPTENLDKMAKEGQRWTDFYVSSPISSPSRAGLLTGRLGVRNGMYGKQVGVLMGGDKDGLPETETTIAEMLKSNEYKTALFGKWHLGEQEQYLPTRHGFDVSYGPLQSNDMYWTEEYGTVEDMMKAFGNKDFTEFQKIMKLHDEMVVQPKESMFNIPVLSSVNNGNGTYIDSYSRMVQTTFTKNITNKAKDYITDNKESPFFLLMTYTQNHVPLFVSPEFSGKTDSLYGDVMQEIDWSVGEIIHHLKAEGIDDNTMIIFTSDNGSWDKPGYVAAGHAADVGELTGGKNRTLEGGSRVPAIIYWKGQIQPQTVSGIGSTLDILPTLATLTNSPLPSYHLDGIDLSSTLLDNEESPREVFPYYLQGRLEAIRVGDWKLHLYSYGDNTEYGSQAKYTGNYELYNLIEDKGEENNIAKFHPEIVKKLIIESEKYQKFVGNLAEPKFDLP